MEQNLPVLPKKVWSLIRVLYFMLRKTISKKKLLLDFNMMMKRAKIAGKSLQNLMFHHHHNWAAAAAAFATTTNNRPSPPEYSNNNICFTTTPPGEYEFSCTTSPNYDHHKKNPFSLFSFHKKQHSGDRPAAEGFDVKGFNAAVLKAMEMIHDSEMTPSPSPALPGFGRSPMVRQLRITDSPFPVSSNEEDGHVDEAAEQFICRFYKDLKLQNSKASFSSS